MRMQQNNVQSTGQNNAQYTCADDLGGLELLQADYKNQCFSKHVHEGYCINVIDKGAQRFYRSGGSHLAPQDSIVLVNADQVHDGEKATDDGWSYRAMYPTPEMLSDISIEFQNRRKDAPWFPSAVVCDPYMANKLRQLFTLLQNSDNSLERETHYLNTITELISRHGKQNQSLAKLGKEPLAVQRTREYMDGYFADNISIQQLADFVQLSPFYLARLFHKVVGLPPHAYQVQRRVNHAKKLIKQDLKLSDVAVDCGFTDQSHLNRNFKKTLGVTPGAYQRMISSKRRFIQ